jgi:hypothetical protein
MVSILELNNFVVETDKKHNDHIKTVKIILGNLNKKVLIKIVK